MSNPAVEITASHSSATRGELRRRRRERRVLAAVAALVLLALLAATAVAVGRPGHAAPVPGSTGSVPAPRLAA
jgi:hypothetical protein